MGDAASTEKVPTFCPLCISRCGAIATLENGAFRALEPDPSHPTGAALCIKGKVAPELVYHPKRLQYPLERTRPKGDADPGWRRIGWDEALDKIAARLAALRDQHGAESVAFACASPSTSALSDSFDWIQRLRRAFGSPNFCVSMELCGWGRYLASAYTYGAPVPGLYLPDLERAGCILFWGYNPSVARLSHATATTKALARGARLIVVDPRRAGLARKAHAWLRVRPGTDGALALGIAGVMIDRGWFDRDFVTRWTNGPFLVRSDDGRLLREADLTPSGASDRYVVWDEAASLPVVYDPAGAPDPRFALFGEHTVTTLHGPVACRPAFEHVAERCRRNDLAAVERITGVSAGDIERAARMLWECRPVAYYAWSGVEQQTNATQTVRAIAQLYALTGSFDAPGGNVRFTDVPVRAVDGSELLADEQRNKSLGIPRRPLGPSRWEFVNSDDVYSAALEGTPYPLRGLVGFGANLLLAHADGVRGRKALAALDFFVHADLFMNPTAELADIVLPVASAFETEGLAAGFDVSQEAKSLVQLRRPLVRARGEARSDVEIVFLLATRLGLGQHFWQGDVDAARRHQLEPSGVTLEALRHEPAGVRVALETRHRKFAESTATGVRGFGTDSRRIELYSEELLSHGHAPVAEFEEPLVSPRSRPDLAARYPLVLTSAKSTWFCESQHRALPSLRRRAPDPQVELHPETAHARGIAQGDWVQIETPNGTARARALLNASLEPGVVCGQNGWWQACEEIGAPGYDPYGPDGANLNLLIDRRAVDPVSGTPPHRSFMCQVAPA
jgi:anaerobic selenocysteine-containing dehydrogenase